MKIEIGTTYRNTDILLTITDFNITPAERMTRHHPGCPAETEILDGFAQLDGYNADSAVVQEVNAQLKNNARFFWALVEAKQDELEDAVFTEAEADYEADRADYLYEQQKYAKLGL